ncbi:MAG: DUF885 family protein, partial [Gemmatimonadota bacterium]|nr:DUF885 family protein [Gemmatimonadota bacterium]
MIGRTIRRITRNRLAVAGVTALLGLTGALVGSVEAAAQETRDAEEDFHARFEALAERDDLDPAERLDALFALDWERNMAWYPEWATWVGWEDADHGAWTDRSLAAIERRNERLGDPMVVLEAIDRDALSPEDRLSYDLYRRDLEMDLEGLRFPGHLMPITQLGGIHQEAANLLANMPARTETDFEAILSRLHGLPEAIDETVVLLEEGLERGVTQPAVPL